MNMIALINFGLGISSIARVLGLAKSVVQRRILYIFRRIQPTPITETNQIYEMDELRTYIGNKKHECWIIYSINRNTRKIINYEIGRRNKINIKKVVDGIMGLAPNKIFTDKLNIYPSLIERSKHCIYNFCTNRIERKNLTLRTQIKWLNRKTICFSKSIEMLRACFGIYLWATNEDKFSLK